MYTELIETLHRVMKESVENSEVMGVNFLVEKGEEEILYCQEGMADKENGMEMNRNTIFRLYSQTKPVTGVAAMILMEQGCLDLCQSVGEILPAFSHLKVEKDGKVVDASRPMLVHDLLRMTSGLVYPDDCTASGKAAGVVFDDACARLHTENPMTTQELAERLAEGPLLFEPGSSWSYGTSADVLGAVIEKVSGKKLSEFMEDEIFKPLGMTDTAFWVPAEKQCRLAKAYETVVKEDGSRAMVPYTGNNLAICNDMAKAPAYEAGGAGLTSTLDDYMKFARMLRNGGTLNGKKIIRPETARYFTGGELMPAQQQAFENWIGLDGFSYSNLMRVCKKPSRCGMIAREGEYGWDGWLGMYFANFPKENMTILMGTQKKDSGTFALTRKLRNIVLSSI